MVDIFPEIAIDENQAEAMAQGLFAVARADGELHPGEAALIAEFYTSTTASSFSLSGLERSPIIPGDLLAQRLPRQELRLVFIKTAILLAHADGTYGPGEAQQITTYAEALEISGEDLAQLQVQVKEYLLAQLSHLKNVEAGAMVAHELDL